MVSSLDGIIAKKDNSVSWFETTDHYEKGVSGENPEAVLKKIDCYIMGARTYEHAWELSKTYGWAYGDTPTVVVTHRNLPVERKNIELFHGDLQQLVREQLQPKYTNIWMVGGAVLAKEFIRLQLADDIRLTIIPILLGDGLLFFDQLGLEKTLQVKNVTAYKNGLVELWYGIKKE